MRNSFRDVIDGGSVITFVRVWPARKALSSHSGDIRKRIVPFVRQMQVFGRYHRYATNRALGPRRAILDTGSCLKHTGQSATQESVPLLGCILIKDSVFRWNVIQAP